MKPIRCLLMLTAFLLAYPVYAQINCDVATGRIERFICSYDGQKDGIYLFDVDRQLNDQYQAARDRTVDKNGLLRSQKEWLVQRDKCGKNAACINARYKERIRELIAMPDQADAICLASKNVPITPQLKALLQSESSTIAPESREVVDGTMIGFAETGASQKELPPFLIAPDGKPDLIFLPKVLGKQDADLKNAYGKKQVFETFFGGKRFVGQIFWELVQERRQLKSICLEDGMQWRLHYKDGINQKNLRVNDSNAPTNLTGSYAQSINNLVFGCDAPGGVSNHYYWPRLNKSFNKFFVRRFSGRDYPCQGMGEEPDGDSYWRRFTGEGNFHSLYDGRDGIFVDASVGGTSLMASIDEGVKENMVLRYVVHLDVNKRYADVEMLRPELMLLDEEALMAFTQKISVEYPIKEKEYEDCLRTTRHLKEKLDDKKSDDLSNQKCGVVMWSAKWVEDKFIQSFVPEQAKRLWSR